MRVSSACWLGLMLCLCGCKRHEKPPPAQAAAPAPGPQASEADEEARFLAAAPSARPLVADPGDLPHLRKRGTLRILVETHEEDRLPREGTPASEEWTALARFARREGLKPEFELVDRFDQLIPDLLAGKGDVIAD
jgi:membrane-bound lytic murein transglycosylase F